jgi:hypothetical protein
MPLPGSVTDLPDPESRHVLRFSAHDLSTALDAVRDGLAASGAEVCNLQLRAVGALVEGVLRLQRLDEAGAVRLCHRLADLPGVLSSRVEHQWGRS